MGMYIKSNSSNTIQSVLIARFNTLVYATSNAYPPSFNNLPPCDASTNPFSFKDASAHPVKMFRSFHVDSPCRTRTSLCACSSLLLLLRLLDVDDDDDDDDDGEILRWWTGVTKPVAVYVLRRASSTTTRIDDVIELEISPVAVLNKIMTSSPQGTASRRNSFSTSSIIPHLLFVVVASDHHTSSLPPTNMAKFNYAAALLVSLLIGESNAFTTINSSVVRGETTSLSATIKSVKAREILDSRGNPTVEVELCTEDGKFVASVPSGASTGAYEACELRDGGARYLGKGVLTAVKNVNSILGPAVLGMDPANQRSVDMKMIDIDGTTNKSSMGANGK